MKKIIQKATALLGIFGGLVMVTSAEAQNAPIDWGLGAQAITGDSDVSTDGTLVNAFNLGDSGVSFTTVNGVTFAGFAFPGFASFTSTVASGDYAFTEISDGGELNSYNNLGTGTGAYSTLSAPYRTLLSSGGSSTLVTTLQLTISALTVGDIYQFQWWDNNSSLATSPTDANQLNTVATAGGVVTLDGNDGTSGSVGQFAIGTFAADDTTQIINFDGVASDPSDPLLNAFQLRVVGVPEPATYALLGMGVLMLATRRHYCRPWETDPFIKLPVPRCLRSVQPRP